MRRRTIDIIRKLLVGDGSTLGELARRFDVSERTIRSDVSNINDILDALGMRMLDYGPGGQILVPEGFGKICWHLPHQAKESYRLSRDERRLVASALLVEASGYMSMSDLAERLSTSRSTIMNDVDAIRDLLAKGYLTLVSRPGRGLVVEGEEAEKRAYLLSSTVSLQRLPMVEGVLDDVRSQEDALIIRKVLNEEDRSYGITMQDDSFGRVVSYLCIAVRRMREGKVLQGDGGSPSDAGERTRRGAFCADILRLVGQYCGVVANRAETDYLEGVLSTISLQAEDEFNAENIKVQVLCRKLIDHVSKGIGVDLNGDYDLFEYLSNHLISMFAMEPPQFAATDDIKEVVGEHADVLNAVHENTAALEEFGNRPISEVELDYVCVHFCAALERRKNREGSLRVIVTCNAGVGTSQLLAENLRCRFSFRIESVIPSHEAELLHKGDADLVISTVPLESCPIESVVVSAYPSEGEYARIQRCVDRIRSSASRRGLLSSGGCSTRGLIDAVASVVRGAAPQLAPTLMPKVASVIRGYFGETGRIEQEILQPFLHQLLPASHIQLDVACKDWKDAIAQSAAPLVRAGYVKPCYVDAMIINVEENGPYLVLSKGFALPHTGTEGGAIKMGMNLVRLAEPVCFGAPEYDPIDLVCCLSATDNKSHLRAFFDLINLLREPAFKAALRDASSPEGAACAIQRFEYRLRA